MSRPSLFLLIISSLTILFSCKTQNDFITILETKINSNSLSVDNDFVGLFNEELLNNYPDKFLVIKEVNDQLVPSFKNFSDISVRDRGNFKIMISDSLFLVNDQSADINNEMKNYLIDLSNSNIKNVDTIELIMQTSKKGEISSFECDKFLFSIKEVGLTIDILRDSISKKRYNLEFSNLDLKKKKNIKTEIGKSFILYLFEDLNTFFTPPPPATEYN